MAVRVSQYVVEALIARAATSPTTPDANTVALSQYVVEALISEDARVRVSQYVVEALVSEGDTPLDPSTPPAPGGVRVFGYAG